jgi:hypothetical protein
LRGSANPPMGCSYPPPPPRGVDLPDDLCRFVVVAKAPFQSLGDKLVASRVYGSGMGAFWYKAICAQDLVQASGRGVRHKDDYCVTYLLDKQIENLVLNHQEPVSQVLEGRGGLCVTLSTGYHGRLQRREAVGHGPSDVTPADDLMRHGASSMVPQPTANPLRGYPMEECERRRREEDPECTNPEQPVGRLALLHGW